jgi:hypothetical protein
MVLSGTFSYTHFACDQSTIEVFLFKAFDIPSYISDKNQTFIYLSSKLFQSTIAMSLEELSETHFHSISGAEQKGIFLFSEWKVGKLVFHYRSFVELMTGVFSNFTSCHINIQAKQKYLN